MKGYVYLPGLRAARLDYGMEAWDLAARIHVSPATLSRWELGDRRAPKDFVPQLAEMLGVTERSLLDHREPAVQTRGRPEGSKNNPGAANAQATSEAGEYYGRQDHIVRSHMERLHRERERVECPAPACKTMSRRTTSWWPYYEEHENYAKGRAS